MSGENQDGKENEDKLFEIMIIMMMMMMMMMTTFANFDAIRRGKGGGENL